MVKCSSKTPPAREALTTERLGLRASPRWPAAYRHEPTAAGRGGGGGGKGSNEGGDLRGSRLRFGDSSGDDAHAWPIRREDEGSKQDEDGDETERERIQDRDKAREDEDEDEDEGEDGRGTAGSTDRKARWTAVRRGTNLERTRVNSEGVYFSTLALAQIFAGCWVGRNVGPIWTGPLQEERLAWTRSMEQK